METIAGSGNIEVPAYLALRKLGFEVTATAKGEQSEQWVATKSDLKLIAASPLELLGLCLMRAERGSSWKPTDEDISDFLERFYPEGR